MQGSDFTTQLPDTVRNTHTHTHTHLPNSVIYAYMCTYIYLSILQWNVQFLTMYCDLKAMHTTHTLSAHLVAVQTVREALRYVGILKQANCTLHRYTLSTRDVVIETVVHTARIDGTLHSVCNTYKYHMHTDILTLVSYCSEALLRIVEEASDTSRNADSMSSNCSSVRLLPFFLHGSVPGL